MEIEKLLKEEKPSRLIEEALKEAMDEGKYEKREAFCTDKSINYERLSWLINNADNTFDILQLVMFKKSRLKKVISFIKGLESLIE